MQANLNHLRDPATKEPAFPAWMRGNQDFELYTLMCRLKKSWPVDDNMSIAWRDNNSNVYVETLERKCRVVIPGEDEEDKSYCDAVYWDRAGLTNHMRNDHPAYKIETRKKKDEDGKDKPNKGGKTSSSDYGPIKTYFKRLVASINKVDSDFFTTLEPLRATMHNNKAEQLLLLAPPVQAPLPGPVIAPPGKGFKNTPAGKASTKKAKKSAKKIEEERKKAAWLKHSNPESITDVLCESSETDVEDGDGDEDDRRPLLPIRKRKRGDQFPEDIDLGGLPSSLYVPDLPVMLQICEIMEIFEGPCEHCQPKNEKKGKKRKTPSDHCEALSTDCDLMEVFSHQTFKVIYSKDEYERLHPQSKKA